MKWPGSLLRNTPIILTLLLSLSGNSYALTESTNKPGYAMYYFNGLAEESDRIAYKAWFVEWYATWVGKNVTYSGDVSRAIVGSPACYETHVKNGAHVKVFQIDVNGFGKFIGGYSKGHEKDKRAQNSRKNFVNKFVKPYCAVIRDVPDTHVENMPDSYFDLEKIIEKYAAMGGRPR